MTKEQTQIIQKTISLLKENYIHDVSAHDWLHLERVWKMAIKLARGENVNQFVLEMAALLHDVDDFKFKKDGSSKPTETLKILKQLGIGEKNQTHIIDIVSHVSYKGAGVETPQKTLEGKIVQDADRLDAIGAIAIARTFAFNGAMSRPIYDPDNKPKLHQTFQSYKTRSNSAINHFYEKLLLLKDRLNTSKARKLAARRHQFMEKYLEEFFREMNEIQ